MGTIVLLVRSLLYSLGDVSPRYLGDGEQPARRRRAAGIKMKRNGYDSFLGMM